MVDVVAEQGTRPRSSCVFRKSIAFWGKTLSAEEILRILRRLGFEFTPNATMETEFL